MMKIVKYSALFIVLYGGLISQTLAQTADDLEFTCRYFGEDYKLGGQICLTTPKGLRHAYCGMVLNNSAWIILPESCVHKTKEQPRTTSKAQSYIEKYKKDYPK